MSEAPQDDQPKVSGRPGGGGPTDYLAALSRGKAGAVDDPTVTQMKHNRRVNGQRTAASGANGVTFATGRSHDPMFYWKANNLPYDVTTAEGMRKVRAYCKLLYQTHPVVASAIDVFSKFPLTGMEIRCKDPALETFYTTLFFDELNYEEFLVEVGRDYWTQGEAFPLGSFNELLGVWEDDELIDPDDVDVIKSPFLKEPRLQMRLPLTIRKIIEDRDPAWEYKQLLDSYPELVNFSAHDSKMPVSNTLLKQIAFKTDSVNPRGVPILLRAFRAIAQEEMLNAAQDAIASRLYTPLILAKLGASASDLGTASPWIPTQDDLEAFEESLDAALAADFRVLTHHFAIEMSSVFGRENMPNMDADFDRLTDRILQAFGMSKTMLTGASAGETYAADAINRDLVTQLLSGYQKKIKKFFYARASVVAEAQQHYDFEVRDGKRYPIMEEVLEVDPETGAQHIVEQPKLLVPELHFKVMNLADESDQRQFYEALRVSGVPISMKSRLMNVPLDLDEERERVRQEQVDLAVEAQETRKQTYQALRDRGLPIPADLLADFQPKTLPPAPSAEDGPLPNLGTAEVNDQALVPVADDQGADAGAGAGDSDADPAAAPDPSDPAVADPASPPTSATVTRLPVNQVMQQGKTRPPESDEARARMPKPASMVRVGADGDRYVDAFTTEDSAPDSTTGMSTPVNRWKRIDLDQGPSRLMDGPRHVGSRTRVVLRDAHGDLLPLD